MTPRQAVASGLLLLPAFVALAASPERTQLDEVEARIHTVQTAIGDNRTARAQLTAELDALDAETERAAAAEQAASRAADAAAAELARLEREVKAAERRLAEQRAILARHIRALAQHGSDDPMQFLLGASDPDRGARSLRDYRFVAEARARALEHVAAQASHLADLRQATAASHMRLADARALAERQHTRLLGLIATRKAKAAELDRAFATDQQRLAALEQERARLTALLEEIARRQRAAGVEPLSTRRGSLPWPVEGELAYPFGSSPPGGVRSSGWFIAAPEGTPVYPVYQGRVAYADWFRGLGLLMIIDHGDANLSLYAHNQRLLATVDSVVSPDEPIALAGASGNATRSGVYFELRIGGQPEDPAAWLASHP